MRVIKKFSWTIDNSAGTAHFNGPLDSELLARYMRAWANGVEKGYVGLSMIDHSGEEIGRLEIEYMDDSCTEVEKSKTD